MPKRKDDAKKQSTPDLTDARIAFIVNLQLNGVFAPGATVKALTGGHPLFRGLSVSRVEELAATASRIIKAKAEALADPKTHKEALGRAILNFQRIRAKAEALGDAERDPKAYSVALAADQLTLDYLGLKPSEKVEFTKRNEFDGWSDDELKEYALTGKRPSRADTGLLDGVNGQSN